MKQSRAQLPTKFVEMLERKAGKGYYLTGVSWLDNDQFVGHFFKGEEHKHLTFRINRDKLKSVIKGKGRA